jgi:hypothetical protein
MSVAPDLGGGRNFWGGPSWKRCWSSRPYEYKVQQIDAQLAEAKQNVKFLMMDVDVATYNAIPTKVDLNHRS